MKRPTLDLEKVPPILAVMVLSRDLLRETSLGEWLP